MNGSNITIDYDFHSDSGNINAYDSSYDAVIYWNTGLAGVNSIFASNVNTVLNQYYINGKGVILGLYSNNNIEFAKISSYTTITGVYNTYSQSESNIIFKNINSVYLSQYVDLSSLNGSTGIGTAPNNNKLLYYLDSNNSNGRRVDLNIYPRSSVSDLNSDTPKLIL
jgi:hypothetical protein